LKLKVYSREEGLSMGLKQFTVNHVRHWEAALFNDLVSDWLERDL
jgi:hypothetical protein